MPADTSNDGRPLKHGRGMKSMLAVALLLLTGLCTSCLAAPAFGAEGWVLPWVTADAPVSSLDAPVLSISGDTVHWSAVGLETSYIVAISNDARGTSDRVTRYLTIPRTTGETQTYTPTLSPGETAYIGVSADEGVTWSEQEATITGSEPEPEPEPESAPTPAAPVLTVQGDTVQWHPIASESSYGVAISNDARGTSDRVTRYLTIPRTTGETQTYTPTLSPGETAYIGVSADEGVTWSEQEATITGSEPEPEPEPEPASTPSAPVLSVSGDTVHWHALSGVASYTLATILNPTTTRNTTYSTVTGTSFTPPALPGQTVNYGLAAHTPTGGPWAEEVTITYPAKTEEPPVEEPKTEEPKAEEPAPSGFEPGLNAGTSMTFDLNGSITLGARLVRIAWESNVTAAQMEPVIAGYAAKNIRVLPLVSFYGSMPTPTQARNLANWAKAYGPGGTYWSSHPTNKEPIQSIEFGNETSYGYQYGGDEASSPSYAARAETYAIRFKEAAEAIDATGIKVGLLAQADNASGNWVKSMYHAVPNLSSYVAGWTIHPYGVGWQTRLQDLISQTAAQGAPSTIPIDITEWGLTTDNGRCLSENYGLNPCMTYDEAAATLTDTVAEMRQMLGSRLHIFILYSVRDEAVTGTSTDREAYFGALQHELQPKGAYTTAAQALLASH